MRDILFRHYYLFVLVFTAIYTFFFVYYLAQRHHHSGTSRSYSLFLMGILLWAVKDALAEALIDSMDTAPFVRMLVCISPLFLSIALFSFNMLVRVYNAAVAGERQFGRTRETMVSIGVLLAGIYAMSLVDPGFLYAGFHRLGGRYVYGISPGLVVFGAILTVSTLVPVVMLLAGSWRTPRSEAFFIGLGGAVTFLVALATNLFPGLAGTQQLPRFGCLSSFIMSALAFYGIVSYGRIFPITRILAEREKSKMITDSMAALVDIGNEEQIYNSICMYARDISDARFSTILFFAEGGSGYTVVSLSASGKKMEQAVLANLPLALHKKHAMHSDGLLGRRTAVREPYECRSVRDFFGNSAVTVQGREADLDTVRQVIVYPIVHETTVRGALVLYLENTVESTELFRVFSTQCSLVLKFSSQIRDIEDMRRLERQLHQAQKMEAIGQLAGGIAHDFNNMLAGISGYAALIKRKFTAGNDELKGMTEQIITAAARASDLTGKLLAFARKGKYQTTVVDIHTTIQEVIMLLERTIDRRIDLQKEFNANPPTIMGDPTLMQNMILNLALNARDAMPDGGRILFKTETITVEGGISKDGQYEIKEGRYLLLSVIDNGTGMDEPTRKRLFEPFFTTKDVGKGTGLGLASVYGTVKSHGGFIVVDSEEGAGSTFQVYLPLVEPAVQEQKAAVQKTETIIRGHGRLLVVDDEEMIRNLAREMLEFFGYTVTVCKDGQEAVGYLKAHPGDVDLAMVDIIMPKMDGYETLKLLREVRPDLKVIITTGYSIRDTQQILSRDLCGFIQKPFESGKLSQLVHDMLHKK